MAKPLIKLPQGCRGERVAAGRSDAKRWSIYSILPALTCPGCLAGSVLVDEHVDGHCESITTEGEAARRNETRGYLGDVVVFYNTPREQMLLKTGRETWEWQPSEGPQTTATTVEPVLDALQRDLLRSSLPARCGWRLDTPDEPQCPSEAKGFAQSSEGAGWVPSCPHHCQRARLIGFKHVVEV